MYGGIGVPAPSLRGEATDSLIHVYTNVGVCFSYISKPCGVAVICSCLSKPYDSYTTCVYFCGCCKCMSKFYIIHVHKQPPLQYVFTFVPRANVCL